MKKKKKENIKLYFEQNEKGKKKKEKQENIYSNKNCGSDAKVHNNRYKYTSSSNINGQKTLSGFRFMFCFSIDESECAKRNFSVFWRNRFHVTLLHTSHLSRFCDFLFFSRTTTFSAQRMYSRRKRMICPPRIEFFFLRFTRLRKKMNTHSFRGQVPSKEIRRKEGRKDRKFAKVLLKSSSCFIKTWRKVSLGNFILGGKWNRAKYFYLPLHSTRAGNITKPMSRYRGATCNRVSKVTFIKKPLFRM